MFPTIRPEKLYQAYNTLFEKHWEEQTGQKVRIIQSHGGSGKQALEVANGLDADVVTLALEGDIKTISDSGLIDPGFTSEFPDDSALYLNDRIPCEKGKSKTDQRLG